MANLLGKLNVLVRSSMNNVGRDSSRRRLPKGDVEALRQQINHALDDEDRQLAGMEVLRQQIASWDQQADKALSAGDEATARHAIRQMQTQQQRLTMLEAELAQHRISTADLINRVNELEAVEARVQQESPPTETKEPASGGLPSRLRQARQNIEQKLSQPDAPPDKIDEGTVDDDLARRRARLSQQD